MNNKGDKNVKNVGLKPNLRTIIRFFILLFLIIFSNNFILSFSSDGQFDLLKGTYGTSPVVIDDNNILLPSSAKGNFLPMQVQLPAQIYNVKLEKFNSLNSYMNKPKSNYISIKIDNDRVLIFGGNLISTKYPNDKKYVEIYDISKNEFRLISNSIFQHATPGVTQIEKLNDGRFFIITEGCAEIFDPITEKFAIAGKITKYYQPNKFDKLGEIEKIRTTNNIYNFSVSTALLDDGRVLVLGANYDNLPGNAEIYNPDTNTFENVSDQVVPMFNRSATTLKDGRVLISGGTEKYYLFSIDKKENLNQIINNVEIFDPKTNKFSLIGSLNIGRESHGSVLLNNGNVLIVNGKLGAGSKTKKNTLPAELYIPKENKFKLISSTQINRYSFKIEKLSHKSILISDYNGWEIYKY